MRKSRRWIKALDRQRMRRALILKYNREEVAVIAEGLGAEVIRLLCGIQGASGETDRLIRGGEEA